MRCLLVSLGLACVLGAQVPLHIVAVERKGLPPYEAADRIYRLDGGQSRGLRVGDRLLVKRSGEPRAIGHVRVVEVRGEQCETLFEPSGSTYPMKGDLVLREELKWPPLCRAFGCRPTSRDVPARSGLRGPTAGGPALLPSATGGPEPGGTQEAGDLGPGVGGRGALGRAGALGQGLVHRSSAEASRHPTGGTQVPGCGGGQGRDRTADQ